MAAEQNRTEELILAYMPLVRGIAGNIRRRLPPWVELDDLVGMGTLALVEAMRRRDPAREVTLEAFVAQRVRGAILDGLRELDPLTRSVRGIVRKMEEVKSQLAQQLQREPSREETAKHLGLDPRTVEGLGESHPEVSLQDFQGEETGHRNTPKRPFPSQLIFRGNEIQTRLELQERNQLLAAAVAELEPRERRVVELYYFEGLNLAQIAERVGGGESRASQILGKALKRLRKTLRGRIES